MISSNILWQEYGHALSVANDSQPGFRSDFNLIHLGPGAEFGEWQAVSISSLGRAHYRTLLAIRGGGFR